MSESNQLQTHSVLFAALRRLCRPLVKLLIEKGITYPQFRDLLKEIYVDVADQMEPIKGKSQSVSRIFVLTGVHRKDIPRLRQRTTGIENGHSSTSSLGAELVAHWLGSAEFQDENGQPRCLSRHSSDNLLGFDDLVVKISKDVRPRTILDEWCRLEIVTINENEQICLNQAAFIPKKDLEEQAFFLGRHLYDHIATCTHNILSDDEPMMERSVYFSDLTTQSIAKLRQTAEHHGMELLQQLNQQAIGLKKADKNEHDANFRMRLGLYWYEQTDKENNDESTP